MKVLEGLRYGTGKYNIWWKLARKMVSAQRKKERNIKTYIVIKKMKKNEKRNKRKRKNPEGNNKKLINIRKKERNGDRRK